MDGGASVVFAQTLEYFAAVETDNRAVCASDKLSPRNHRRMAPYPARTGSE